jgi:hypothetical protein
MEMFTQDNSLRDKLDGPDPSGASAISASSVDASCSKSNASAYLPMKPAQNASMQNSSFQIANLLDVRPDYFFAVTRKTVGRSSEIQIGRTPSHRITQSVGPRSRSAYQGFRQRSKPTLVT